MATPTFGMYVSLKVLILIIQSAVIIYGMYIVEYTEQNQGRQEETHHTAHGFRRLFPALLLMGLGGGINAMRVLKAPILLFYSKNHYIINLYITT